jgi:hypothetical protein
MNEDNGDLYSRLSSDIDQVVRLIFSGILVLVFLPMLIEYFNGYVCARSFGIAYQIKTIGESSLVFLGLWFGNYLWLHSKKYKIVSWNKKKCKIVSRDLDHLLVYFRLYFITVADSSCFSTMYYLLL